MKCPVCSSEVKELYNLNTETDEFKCFGCHLTDLDRRVRRLERRENKSGNYTGGLLLFETIKYTRDKVSTVAN